MSVNLDSPGLDLQGIARFQQAPTQARRLRLLVYSAAAAAVLLGGLAFFVGLFAPASYWAPLLSINAAAWLLVAASSQAAWGVAGWRAAAIGQPSAQLAFWRKAGQEEGDPELLSPYERWLERLGALCLRQLQRVGGDALWLFGLALLALLLVQAHWRLDLPAAALASQASWVAVGTWALLAFGLVVVERHLASSDGNVWPEAAALAAQLRLLIAVLVLSIACLAFADGERLWPARLAVLIGLLPGLLAIELMLRAVLAVFSPRHPRREPQWLARSLVAGALQWPPRPLAYLQGELHQRLGIDLQQIWAFGFMRRALLPVLALVGLAGWLLTGVVEVPMDGRGVYERFGNPVQVYQPGLHLGLPWPLGKVMQVDNGTLHELASTGDAAAAEPLAAAEGPAPVGANRLWDATHISENAQVIAGSDGGAQSFQIVNMDVRFIYRIGLSDAAALAATYHSSDIEQLLRSVANRVLVHDFAGRSLDGVLGEAREALGQDIGRAVQADLDRLDSGVEILATAIEAIHPPAGAANAYHGVQAAQINADALIARDRGQAAQQASLARQTATLAADSASAGAHETRAKAQAAALVFDAERAAWAGAGQAFVLEQYLGRLSQGLAGAHSLIIDHRLGATQAPTLDLRSYALPVDPAVSTSSSRNQEHAK
ncbi:protease modulator HflK [Pseudomonas sichuanensis]|uniref:Protease modulator HflK n=1 Tax=Pseudomonas sichuanensis TaxID=2213015 RepID=A0ABV0DCJ9_9PSED